MYVSNILPSQIERNKETERQHELLVDKAAPAMAKRKTILWVNLPKNL